jgi:glutathione-regulated potassium-efflux system ancillary protein KefG
MVYLPPFAVHGTHLLTNNDLENYARLYRTLLERLVTGEFDIESMKKFPYLNDWLSREAGMSKL